jgi:signal transduction histidine kinase
VLVLLAAAAAFTVAWRSDVSPAPLLPEGYSLAAQAANVVGGLGFVAAAVFFFRRCIRQLQIEDLVFAGQTLLFGVAGLFFAFTHLWSAGWWIAHGFRLLAYAILLVVGFGQVVALYQQIARYARELEGRVEARSAELASAAAGLRRLAAIVESSDDAIYSKSLEGVTEQKRSQAELEAKIAELERFTYTVSHDLKSPLITIQGFLAEIERDCGQGRFDRISGDLERIRKAAQRMQQLLDELLELARIGRIANPPAEVSLADLVREALAFVTGRIKQANITVDVAADLPGVYGDRHRLVEVLQNLIDNAAKFMGAQAAPRIEIGGRLEGNLAMCYVRDNGMGIESRYYDRIFGLFDKLDAHSEGTGVGLAVVKRIIEIHGGRIWVESAGAGCGSTFCFTLPTNGKADQHEH